MVTLLQVKRVRCEASGVLVPKDKAVKRFIVRNIVDASAIRDIQDSSVVDGARRLSSILVGMVQLAGCSSTLHQADEGTSAGVLAAGAPCWVMP